MRLLRRRLWGLGLRVRILRRRLWGLGLRVRILRRRLWGVRLQSDSANSACGASGPKGVV